MENILQYLHHFSPLTIYIVLFISAFFENIFPPIPGDTVTIIGAYLVGAMGLNFFYVVGATTAGSLIGFMTLYAVGFHYGRNFFIKKNFRFFSRKHMENAEIWFKKYGFWVILGNRFLSGIRSVISLMSGISRYSWIKVTILSFISCLVWNSLLITGGYLLGKNWKYVIKIVKTYNIAILFISIFLIISFIIYKRYKTNIS